MLHDLSVAHKYDDLEYGGPIIQTVVPYTLKVIHSVGRKSLVKYFFLKVLVNDCYQKDMKNTQ